MKTNTKKHNHEECRRLLGTLSEYVDGELSEELCAVLEEHMEECENCRIVVDTLRKTVHLYHKTNESEEMPTDTRQRLYKTLNLDEFLEK